MLGRVDLLSRRTLLEVVKILHKVDFVFLDRLPVKNSKLREPKLGGKVVSFMILFEFVRLSRVFQLVFVHG